MNILFLGDIVGRPGRLAVKDNLSYLKDKYRIDFVIANGENATHGKGLSLSHYKDLISYGINCITMGNHYFKVDEVMTKNDQYVNMVRPYNFSPSVPGKGTMMFNVNGVKVRVINLIGRVFVEGADSNPFEDLDFILNNEEKGNITFVDFHAEATGEKMSLARAFDGRISCLIGTHTHVQTNDARILPKGTGFMSDAGMCGFYEGILGVDPVNVIKHTSLGVPTRFEVPESGRAELNGAVINIDEKTGKTNSIFSIHLFTDDKTPKQVILG